MSADRIYTTSVPQDPETIDAALAAAGLVKGTHWNGTSCQVDPPPYTTTVHMLDAAGSAENAIVDAQFPGVTPTVVNV